jgi:DNA mismatch repair protein MutS2
VADARSLQVHLGALRALEFDRIVAVVAVTPTGQDRLGQLSPLTDASAVLAAQGATTEGTRFLAARSGFPLRAAADLNDILEALHVMGRALEPRRLLSLSDYLESVDETRRAVGSTASDPRAAAWPILASLVQKIASFRTEIADVRRKIDPGGEVADTASPALASLRDRLRKQKAKLRTTLETFLRERETSKYLQEQVVTDRNGRYVLMVRAEHRAAVPGIVHGTSASGASLFLEPLGTVDINNDIVALEEQEAEEVRRILLELTDAFRSRPEDLERTIEVATELDTVQARARFSLLTGGIQPAIAADGAFELRAARHPLLMSAVQRREAVVEAIGPPDAPREDRVQADSPPSEPVPVDVLLTPPARVLIVTGPNTGGKTVALKTAGLFALMAQAGLHLPADEGSRLPVFRSLFADIGDEQSISASLSTFSAHVANVVSMDRSLTLPALVLLDEVGAGTDPAEGGALGTAVIDHFRQRGAHVVATTHYDVLKTYASTTEGVVSGAFGFDPRTFAPTYRLLYGSPGRSLAIEIASRLGMPASVIAAARGNLSTGERQLAERLERVDRELAGLQDERKALGRERMAVAESDRVVRGREMSLREREQAFKRRLDAKLGDELRAARKEIDAVVEGLRAKTSALAEKGARRAAITVNTGEAGAAKSEALAALDAVVKRVQRSAGATTATGQHAANGEAASPLHDPREEDKGTPAVVLGPGVRVAVGALDLEGVVIEVRDKHVEVDVRGKRLRAKLADLRVVGGRAGRASGNTVPTPKPVVSINLQPREGLLSELNVIGCTADETRDRVHRFLDDAMVTDVRVLRIVHGHGTGQLRRAVAELLRGHPLVARFELAPPEQGGGGATIVELKD